MVDYLGADEYGADELKHLSNEASQDYSSMAGELLRPHEYPSRVAPRAGCSLFKAVSSRQPTAGSRAPSILVSPTINNTCHDGVVPHALLALLQGRLSSDSHSGMVEHGLASLGLHTWCYLCYRTCVLFHIHSLRMMSRDRLASGYMSQPRSGAGGTGARACFKTTSSDNNGLLYLQAICCMLLSGTHLKFADSKD